MLKLENLQVRIQRAPVLRGVSLLAAARATTGLIGRNGAGKTTLMRTIMGLLQADSGDVEFAGMDLLNTPAHRRAQLEIGYLPEDRRLIPQFSVEENLLVPLWATRRGDIQDRLDWVYGLIPEIYAHRQRRALSLSGGQQKLVALGRALVCGRRLLLLDEPFEGVAPVLAERLIEVLTNLKREGVSILVSESDYTHSADLADALYAIDRGQITTINAVKEN